MSIQNPSASGILCHHYRPTGQGNKCPFKTDWPVAYIAIAHRPARIFVTITDRLAKVINVHSKLTGQWHIAIAHRPAGIFVTITDRLAKVINVHSKPTSQWHIAIAHQPAGILCHHYRPTGQGNKCPFKTDWPVAYIAVAHRPAGILCHHYRPTGRGNTCLFKTNWPVAYIAVTHRLAGILCHHYRPTGQGNKCPFKTDRPVAYIAVAHRPARILCPHYRPTGRGNKCPFKTDQPVAYGYRSCHHYRPEHSMSKNEYCYTQLHCTLTPSEPWRRIFSTMLRGLASASKPLGLTPVSSENLFDGY